MQCKGKKDETVVASSSIINVTHPKKTGLFLRRSVKKKRIRGCRGRPVVPGGAGGAMAPPDFDKSVNPISTRGADYAPASLLAPPDFQTFLRPCEAVHNFPLLPPAKLRKKKRK